MPLELQQSIDIANNCKSFDLMDDTGVYSATNTGGYGSPNPIVTDVTEATIEVLRFDEETVYTIDVLTDLQAGENPITVLNTDLGLSEDDTITDGVYLVTYTISGELEIVAVDQGTDTFTVEGNKSTTYEVGDVITVTDSTGNDGNYTIESIDYSAPNTLITVTTDIPSAVADGSITFTAEISEYKLFSCNARACITTKLSQIDISSCADCADSKVKLISKIRTFLELANYSAGCGRAAHAEAILSYVNQLCGNSNCTSC